MANFFSRAGVAAGGVLFILAAAAGITAWQIRQSNQQFDAEAKERAARATDLEKEIARIRAQSAKEIEQYKRDVVEAEAQARQVAQSAAVPTPPAQQEQDSYSSLPRITMAQLEDAHQRRVMAIYADRSKTFASMEAEVEILESSYKLQRRYLELQERLEDARQRYQQALQGHTAR